MKSFLNHLQINIDIKHIEFYKDLMNFLAWEQVLDETTMIGFSDGKSSIWFIQKKIESSNNYDGIGVNHIGIGVESISEVDATAEYIKDKRMVLLFDTPKHRPEFSGPDKTYYQVMFESPDHILFEIVYTGAK